MVPIQFFGQNIHFALSLFTALVFFAVFWLEYDAWLVRRDRKELVKWLGFGLIALSFITGAIGNTASVDKTSADLVLQFITFVCRGLGFAGVIAGQMLDPLQQVPTLPGISEEQFAKQSKTRHHALAMTSLPSAVQLLLPIGAGVIAALYMRRATTGLERHYKPVALSFGMFSLYALLSTATMYQNSTNPLIARAVAGYGPVWIAAHIVLLSAALILGVWVWKYLTRRFTSQLFMILTALTMGIFLLTTISFTYLLVSNIQKSSLDNLQTAASVLSYAVDGKKSEITAKGQSIAENSSVRSAVAAGDHKTLTDLAQPVLQDKKLSSLIIVDTNGQVLLRGEDPERYGDSLSSDTLVRRALIGTSVASVTVKDGVMAPNLSIRSAVPIRGNDGSIIGAALSSLAIDNSFVDTIKRSTGLDSALYAGNIRSATTFTVPGSTSRWIGVKETTPSITETVLKHDRTFRGLVSIQNNTYLAVYSPLKDADNTVVGMVFIGQPQTAVQQASARSIQLTFIVTAVLLILSIIPAYLMSRYIAGQLS